MSEDEPGEADLTSLKSLIQGGDRAEAKRRAEDLLRTHPGSAQLRNMLGILALGSGDTGTAEGLFREALDLSPAFTGAAANLGVSLMKRRKFEEAIDVLATAIRHDPRAVQPRTVLANALLNAKRYGEAFDQSTELLALAPDNADVLKLRATAALNACDWPSVHAALERLEAVAGENEWSVRTRFDALAGSGRTEEAIAHGEAQVGTYPRLHAPLGELLVELGRFDEARDRLRKAIAHDPDDARAYFHYGMSAKWSQEDPLLGQLKAAAAGFVQTPRPGGASALFALAKASMDLKDHAAVFPALAKANEFQRRDWRFDPELQAKQADDIRTTWTAEAIAALRETGIGDVAPVYIVGMPRSGSTLTEHVIEAHPAITSVGESSATARFFPVRMPADPEALAEAARAAAEEIRRLAGPGGRLLDKYLYNYQRLGSLAAAFPGARFVQTQRDPRAIALSIYSNPLKIEQHPYTTTLTDIAHFFVEYHKLMQHWSAVLGDRVIVSDYQALVDDPEPSIRALIDRLDLPWDDACLEPEAVQKRVRTLSAGQVRSGIHSGSVERWRSYEAELAPFTEIVAEVWDFEAGRPVG